MALFCRSVIMAGSKSLTARSKTLTRRGLNAKPISSAFFSSPTRSIVSASRVVSILGCVESLTPFHTATANARLKSNIAVDSSCWSWLSQAYANLSSQILLFHLFSVIFGFLLAAHRASGENG